MANNDIQATYGIELAVEGVEETKDAAKALEDLRDRIGEDTAALGAMQKALRGMQGGVVVNIQAARNLRAAIAAKKVEIAQANTQLVQMKGAFNGLGPAAKRAQAATESLAFKEMKSAALGGSNALRGLSLSTLKALPPHVALAVGVLAVSSALAVATAAALKFGIATADLRRTEQIDIQAAGTRIWYGYANAVMFAKDETEAGAKAISTAIDRATLSTTVGRERVLGFAKELEAAGLRGQDLETSLKAVSTAASVGKESGLVGMFASLRFAGAGVDALAARIQTKLGPLVERKMLSLDAQFGRLRENLGLLFKNVNVVPFLKALDKILGLFSQTKAVGYALRTAIEALFPTTSAQTFGDVAVQVFKEVVIQGLRVTVGLLSLELMFYRARNAWSKWGTAVTNLDPNLRALFKTLQDIGGVLEKIQGLSLAALNPFATGDSIAKGVGVGIDANEPGLKQKATELGHKIDQWFEDSLKIHSPSGLFRESARQIPRGAALGIDDEADKPQDAVDRMTPSPRANGESSGGRGAVNLTVSVGEVHVNAPNAKNGADVMQAFETQMSDVLERMAQRLAAQLKVA